MKSEIKYGLFAILVIFLFLAAYVWKEYSDVEPAQDDSIYMQPAPATR